MVQREGNAEVVEFAIDRFGEPRQFLRRGAVQPFQQAGKYLLTLRVTLVFAEEPVGIVVFKQSMPRADGRLPCISENLLIALTSTLVQCNGVTLTRQPPVGTETFTVRSPVT